MARKNYSICINTEGDKDIYDLIDEMEGRNSFLKKLIRMYMNGQFIEAEETIIDKTKDKNNTEVIQTLVQNADETNRTMNQIQNTLQELLNNMNSPRVIYSPNPSYVTHETALRETSITKEEEKEEELITPSFKRKIPTDVKNSILNMKSR